MEERKEGREEGGKGEKRKGEGREGRKEGDKGERVKWRAGRRK